MADEPQVQQKIQEYETFLNDVLRGDLKKAVDLRDKITGDIAEHVQLKNLVESLQKAEVDGSSLDTKVDIGCNFYVQAHVPDSSMLFVKVGYGFHVEMTWSETLKFVDKKIAYLNQQLDELSKTSSDIKAKIKMVLEGLRELQQISSAKDLPLYE
nr:EOG090X0MWD [Triops cancriformis]